MVDRIDRPQVPLTNPDEAAHRRQLAVRANASLPKDGSEAATMPLRLMTYTVASLPDATLWPGAIIYVSDGASGQRFRGSNGSAWVNLG